MKKGEGKMMRFFLIVVVGWIAAKVVGLLFRSMTQPTQPRRPKENNFGETKSHPEMEFKDVQDAEFTEIKEKEHAAK
jgi:hypothetical protein